jgi:hypothetical protein
MRKNARKRLHRQVASYLALVDQLRQEGREPHWQKEMAGV